MSNKCVGKVATWPVTTCTWDVHHPICGSIADLSTGLFNLSTIGTKCINSALKLRIYGLTSMTETVALLDPRLFDVTKKEEAGTQHSLVDLPNAPDRSPDREGIISSSRNMSETVSCNNMVGGLSGNLVLGAEGGPDRGPIR